MTGALRHTQLFTWVLGDLNSDLMLVHQTLCPMSHLPTLLASYKSDVDAKINLVGLQKNMICRADMYTAHTAAVS